MPAPEIPDRLRRRHRRRAHPLPQLGGHRHRRRLLDQLLVSPLHRALALAEMNRAPGVGQDLELDVPGPLDVLLEIHASVAEGLDRLGDGGRDCAGQIGIASGPGAFPGRRRPRRPSSSPGIRSRRPARASPRGRSAGVTAAGNDRHAGLTHAPPGLRLVAHRPDRGGRRSRRKSGPPASTASANAARSARKPYPGCTASAPAPAAASRSRSMSR